VSVLPYIVAQLIGSVLGVLAARAVRGVAVENPPVANATLHSGLGWSAGELFAAETANMGLIVYAIGFFLQTPKLAPLVPWLAGLLIAAVIALLGTATGGSVNPARQFGRRWSLGNSASCGSTCSPPWWGLRSRPPSWAGCAGTAPCSPIGCAAPTPTAPPCDGLSNERCNQSAAFWTQTSRSLLSEWRHAWGAVYRLFRTPEPEKLMELVRDAMTTRCVTVPPYTSLTAVAACMRDDNVGCVMVTHDGALQGIITDRDITVRITAEGLIAGTTTAQQAASKSLVTVVPGATLCDAAALMCMHNFHRLPVVEQGQLVGLLSLGDICETPHAQEILVALSQAEANH
jgi:CBS domain-containing protein